MPAGLSNSWPFLLTAGFTALLGYFTWKQPQRPGKRYFMMMVALWLVMALAASLEVMAPTETGRLIAVQIQILSALLGAPVLLFFSLEYTGNQRWLGRSRIILLMLPVILVGILILTDPFHHLIWSDLRFGAEVTAVRAPTAWVGIVLFYIYFLATVVVLVGCMLRAPAFWAPILLLLIGQAVPRMAFLLATPQITSYSPLQLSVLAGNMTMLAYFLGIFNLRLLRVLPVARDAALESMDYSVIVLDAEDRVIDLNSAARALPGLGVSNAVGKPASQVLGIWWDHIAPMIGARPILKEMILSGEQVFELHSLPLFHASGWRMGHMFILDNITPAWRARQQLAQQQWAQATLQERQQIAQELHDGLSQNLAFLNVESQAAQIYMKTGQVEAAQACVARLIEVLNQMQGNTREMIGDLMIVSSPVEGFIATLRQVLNGFEKQTGVKVKLTIGNETESGRPDILDPTMVVQLLRIIQEALANVRKHAKKVHQVEVNLAVLNGQMHVTITDDGVGFDTVSVLSTQNKHFGLRIMRQRAARIGAQFSVHSEIGQGTRIEVWIPINSTRNKYEYSPG
jgi:signal transduction histidine kinase